MPNNLTLLLFKVLKAYGVQVTQHTIDRIINTHPEYPSMQSISDALDSWKVKHAVAKLSFETLRTLAIPVIAHLKRGEYVWVTHITEVYCCFFQKYCYLLSTLLVVILVMC
jgi:ABC-type bacteriocin/lantibiotic exporter with double-glycine peptidase domain